MHESCCVSKSFGNKRKEKRKKNPVHFSIFLFQDHINNIIVIMTIIKIKRDMRGEKQTKTGRAQ